MSIRVGAGVVWSGEGTLASPMVGKRGHASALSAASKDEGRLYKRLLKNPTPESSPSYSDRAHFGCYWYVNRGKEPRLTQLYLSPYKK